MEEQVIEEGVRDTRVTPREVALQGLYNAEQQVTYFKNVLKQLEYEAETEDITMIYAGI